MASSNSCDVCGKPLLLPLAVPHPTLSVSLRAILPSDAPSIAHHANDERVNRYLPPHFPRPYTEQHADAYIGAMYARHHDDWPDAIPPPAALLALPAPQLRHALHHSALSSFVVAVDDAAVGTLVVFPQAEPSAPLVLGYWLGEAYHRQGVMTAVLRTNIAWKEERVERRLAQSGVGGERPASWQVVVQRENEANLAVVAKLGFVLSKEETEETDGKEVHLCILDRPWGWRDPATVG